MDGDSVGFTLFDLLVGGVVKDVELMIFAMADHAVIDNRECDQLLDLATNFMAKFSDEVTSKAPWTKGVVLDDGVIEDMGY